MKKSCENCGTRLMLGCSTYRAEDCGPDMREWTYGLVHCGDIRVQGINHNKSKKSIISCVYEFI